MIEKSDGFYESEQPWPWGPAEEYLALYEQYIIGAIEDEPSLPEGLGTDDVAYIEDGKKFIEFQADNYLRGSTADALDAYRTLKEIQELPEQPAEF